MNLPRGETCSGRRDAMTEARRQPGQGRILAVNSGRAERAAVEIVQFVEGTVAKPPHCGFMTCDDIEPDRQEWIGVPTAELTRKGFWRRRIISTG